MTKLKNQGITFRGKPFARTTIYCILQNDKYIGVYKHEDEVIDNMYPKILDDELFRKVSNISDESAINIVNDRCLGKYCLDDVDTDDLEDEITTRWDCSMVKEEELTFQIKYENDFYTKETDKIIGKKVLKILSFLK